MVVEEEKEEDIPSSFSPSPSSPLSPPPSPPSPSPLSPPPPSPSFSTQKMEEGGGGGEGEEAFFPRGKRSDCGCCNILAFFCSCCGFSCYGDEGDGFEWRCCGHLLCQEMCCCAICCCCCCISLNSWAFMIRSTFGVGVGGGGGTTDRSLGWSLQGIWGLTDEELEIARNQHQKLLVDSYGSYNTTTSGSDL